MHIKTDVMADAMREVLTQRLSVPVLIFREGVDGDAVERTVLFPAEDAAGFDGSNDGALGSEHYVANLGRSSFDTFITLERTDDLGVVYAEGGATTVWVDFPTGKSMPVPDWLRTLIA